MPHWIELILVVANDDTCATDELNQTVDITREGGRDGGRYQMVGKLSWISLP